MRKSPAILVSTHRDLEIGVVNVRVHGHGQGNLGAKPRGEVVADILGSIRERRS